MKAAVLDAGELVIRDVSIPVPGPGQALIRVVSAGVCHSDLSLVRHDGDDFPLDAPLGHEAIGVVEALGPGAERFVELGDRVIAAAGCDQWCGTCRACLEGNTPYCAQNRSVLGLFRERFALDARSLVRLPDNVSDLEAPLACGGLTAYGAVKKLVKFGVLPGRPVAILGAAGGLGHYAVQLASAFGYQVVGVDVGPERLEFVEALGASIAVDPAGAVDAARSAFGGVDASLVFPGSMSAHQLGWDLLGVGGLLVTVGIIPTRDGVFALDFNDLRKKNATIASSVVGNVQDMREVVTLVAAGKVKSHITRTGPLSQLGNMLEELGSNQILGRAVINDFTG